MDSHSGLIKSKTYLMRVCISFTIFLFLFITKPVFPRDYSASDFYPLEIGNEWQYKHTYFMKEMVGPKQSKILISSEADKGKGIVEFRAENNVIFMYKTNDGIMSASGFLILKNPLQPRARWTSGAYNYDQRQHLVEAVDLPVNVEGKTYTHCIRIASQSDFHAFVREGQTTYLSYESKDVYCPNAGPVLMETFEITKSGDRKLVSRSELVSFKKGQPVKEKIGKDGKGFKLIEANESFRFPEKGFYHPLLSPEDRWLIYRKKSSQRDADTMWKQLFYNRLGNLEEKLVPLFPRNERHELEDVGVYVEWSPDGKILALSAKVNGHDRIALVDFSGTNPQPLESLKAEKIPFQWAGNFLLYVDDGGHLVKKFPDKNPERVLSSGAKSPEGRIDYFRCAKDGTLLYRIGRKIYRTNLKALDSHAMVYEGAASPNFDLSNTGRYAFISIPDSQDPSIRKAMLVDLNTNKIYNIPVPVKKAIFSPDGRRLAYIEKSPPPHYPSKIEHRNPHFFILDTSTMRVVDYGYDVSDAFGWTPDGNRIIYSMKCIHPSLAAYENGIFIMQVSDGKEIAKLTSMNAVGPAVISSSGKYILWEGMDMDTFFVVKNPL